MEPIPMKWKPLTLLGAAVLLGASLLAAMAQRPSPAAASQLPAPGSLELFDRQGNPAGACALKHTAVEADVAGFVARVTVRQQFQNPSKDPLEAVYTFPLPEDAAVDDMTMTIGNRVIRGEVKRREEARAIYEAARAAGQSAALLDQERPNIFTQAVANLMPGAPITISISYVHLLKYEEGEYEFTFPMVVGPRYTPTGGYTVPGRRGEPSSTLPPAVLEDGRGPQSVVTDADRITPPITPPNTRAGHDISVRVRLDAGVPVADIRSPLHRVDVRNDGESRATVTLAGGKTIPNKDFILRYRTAGDGIATGLLTHATGKGDGTFTLILQPPKSPPAADVAPKEMVFVIDQTGSQSGLPIEKAKETMKFCLENLNPGDTFQLLGFNTQVFPCFQAPVPVSEQNVSRALGFLAPLQGNGGTDILKAVDYCLKIPADPARPRIICYMTDGYVGNDMQILDYIRKNRGEARMFPFGIGNSVNRFLIEGMAKEGRGAPCIVTLGTPGAEAAAKFYERIAKPLLLDVSMDWQGLPVEEVLPRAIPDVFSSTPIILKGRYRTPAEGVITVRGLLRGKPWSEDVKVSLPAQDRDGAAISTLWAREKIEDLQSQDWLGQQHGAASAAIVDQIVGLALDYRLVTQHTSFVAVEQRVVNVGGKQRRVDVPVEMPEGVSYRGIFGDSAEQELQLGFRAQGAIAAGGAFYAAPGLKRTMPGARAAGAPASPMSVGLAPPAGFGGYAGRAPAQSRAAAESRQSAPIGPSGIPPRQTDELTRSEQPSATPEMLAQAKLAEDLRPRIGKPGILNVQIWLADAPKDARKQLKKLGFDLAAELLPGRLMLGRIRGERLQALLKLTWVRRVETPRFLP